MSAAYALSLRVATHNTLRWRAHAAPSAHMAHRAPTRMTLSVRRHAVFADWNIMKRVRVLCVAVLIRGRAFAGR